MADQAQEPTFWATVWAKLKAMGHWCAVKIAAPGVALILAILLIAGAVILASMGWKELQIGGLLGKLFRKSGDGVQANPDVVNTVPPGRVDKDGNLIPPGTPDSKGIVQAVVVPIEDNGGLFTDPTKITVTPPGQDPINVILPDGVKAKDVTGVIIVSPTDVVVTVKDSSGIPAKKIDDLLSKYGG